jgi:hypothetical protein
VIGEIRLIGRNRVFEASTMASIIPTSKFPVQTQAEADRQALLRRLAPVAGSGSPPVASATAGGQPAPGNGPPPPPPPPPVNFPDVDAAHAPMTAMHVLRQADAVSLLADGRFYTGAAVNALRNR